MVISSSPGEETSKYLDVQGRQRVERTADWVERVNTNEIYKMKILEVGCRHLGDLKNSSSLSLTQS